MSELEKQISGLLKDGVNKLRQRLAEVLIMTATVLQYTLTFKVSH